MFIIKEYNLIESGSNIAKQRIDKGYSEKKLADMLGVSQQSIQQIESGKKKISLKMLSDMMQVFETTSDYLLGFISDPKINVSTMDSLGLSERAVDNIKLIKYSDETARLLDKLLEDEQLYSALKNVSIAIQNRNKTTGHFIINGYSELSEKDKKTIENMEKKYHIVILDNIQASEYYIKKAAESIISILTIGEV